MNAYRVGPLNVSHYYTVHDKPSRWHTFVSVTSLYDRYLGIQTKKGNHMNVSCTGGQGVCYHNRLIMEKQDWNGSMLLALHYNIYLLFAATCLGLHCIHHVYKPTLTSCFKHCRSWIQKKKKNSASHLTRLNLKLEMCMKLTKYVLCM